MQFVSQFIIHSRLFAASHSRATKPPCWRLTKVALGLYAFRLSCLSATLLSSTAVLYHVNCQLQRAYFSGVKHQVDGKFKKLSVYPQHRRKKHLAMSVPRIIGYTTEDVKQNYKNQSKSIEECTDCTQAIFHEFLRNVYLQGLKTCFYNLLPSENLDFVQIISVTMV